MKRLLSILFALSLAAAADDFMVHIHMDNAQIEEVILGCTAKATDQYDKGLDIYAPPMSMGTAVAGLLLNRQSQMILYKDVRSAKFPQTWLLDCKLMKNKPLTLSWKPETLPKGVVCSIQPPKQQPMDMRKTSKCKIIENGVIAITFTQNTLEKTSEQK